MLFALKTIAQFMFTDHLHPLSIDRFQRAILQLRECDKRMKRTTNLGNEKKLVKSSKTNGENVWV